MPRLTKAQQAVRRKAVAEGLADGKNITQIAAELGVDRHTVGDDVKLVGSSVAQWAEGGQAAAVTAALGNYQWIVDAARHGFESDSTTMHKWLAGAYDRTELHPDPDGGMREVRKPPSLRLERAAFLGRAISATDKMSKVAGVAQPAADDSKSQSPTHWEVRLVEVPRGGPAAPGGANSAGEGGAASASEE